MPVLVLGQFGYALDLFLKGHPELEQARWLALDRRDAVLHIHSSKKGTKVAADNPRAVEGKTPPTPPHTLTPQPHRS